MEMGEESSTANSNNFTGATSTTSGGWSFVINVKDLDGQGCKILVLSAFSEEVIILPNPQLICTNQKI